MRHKYIIRMTDDRKEILISELAEVDKDMFSSLCEETFTLDVLTPSAAEGDDALVAALRSVNFYPPMEYATQIAAAVKEILDSENPERRELIIDDRQVLEAEEAEMAEAAELSSEESLPPEVEDLDDLLKDDTAKGITTLKEKDGGEKDDN